MELALQYGHFAAAYTLLHRDNPMNRAQPEKLLITDSYEEYRTPLHCKHSLAVLLARRATLCYKLAAEQHRLVEYMKHDGKAIPIGNMRSRIQEWEMLLNDVSVAINAIEDPSYNGWYSAEAEGGAEAGAEGEVEAEGER
jgi:hypothetical protein